MAAAIVLPALLALVPLMKTKLPEIERDHDEAEVKGLRHMLRAVGQDQKRFSIRTVLQWSHQSLKIVGAKGPAGNL